MYGHYFQLIFRTGRIGIKVDKVTKKYPNNLQIKVIRAYEKFV